MQAVRSLSERQLRGLIKYATPAETRRWWGTTLALRHLPHTKPIISGKTCEALELQVTSAGDVEQFAAQPADKVEEVERKNLQLRACLKTTRWPKLTHFEVQGHMYHLPLPVLRKERADMGTVQDATVRFLAGFFDGDGCVSCKVDLSGCYLTVGQCFDRAEILMLFRNSFGGSITLSSDGLGLHKPVLQWKVFGQLARMAARLMAPHSITKQRQLLLAAEWPEARCRKQEFKAELRSLKQFDSAVAGTCSWEYVAGFFDAEGWIGQPRGGVSIVLVVKQKHPSVLECLCTFLERSQYTKVPFPKVRSDPQAYSLRISGLLVCKQILHEMLKAGLLGKAKQARLATSLTKQSAASRSAEMADLTGNQCFARRLDSAGHERARKIHSARVQAAYFNRRGQQQKAESKLDEIETLLHEHKLLNTRLQNQRLLEYLYNIRKAWASAQHVQPWGTGLRCETTCLKNTSFVRKRRSVALQ